MKKQIVNKGKWLDECKPVIQSNGELSPAMKKYHINCDLNVTAAEGMTASELKALAYYCTCIAEAYKHAEQYIV